MREKGEKKRGRDRQTEQGISFKVNVYILLWETVYQFFRTPLLFCLEKLLSHQGIHCLLKRKSFYVKLLKKKST